VSESDTVKDSAEFGANEWLVDELWTLFQKDPELVEKSWWPLFESRSPHHDAPAAPAPSEAPAISLGDDPSPMTAPIAKTTSAGPQEQPIPAEAPTSANPIVAEAPAEAEPELRDEVSPLKGMAKALAANMDQSLRVPTATSVRTVPAKLMIDNRIVVNNHLRRTRGGKVSFTHLIAWAMIKALRELPSQNVFYEEVEGKPVAVHPQHQPGYRY